MEKKLLALLFIIGIIIYHIVQALPLIVGSAVIIYLLYKLNVQHPKGYAKWGAKLITPVLTIGWLYIGYLCYANLYYNTYYIKAADSDINPFPYISFMAKNDEEAIIKAQNKLDEKKKEEVENQIYCERYLLLNHTKEKIVLYSIY